MSASPRIAPAEAPYPPEIQARFDAVMPPGVAPLILFRTLARDRRLFQRFIGRRPARQGASDAAAARDRHRPRHRPLRLRVRVGRARRLLRQARRLRRGAAALAGRGGPGDACWKPEEALLIRFCDALHASCDIDDALWTELRAQFSEEAMLELLLLAGFYRTVSYLTNALRLPLEAYAARFPSSA